MNALGIIVFWVVVQVTVLALVAGLLYMGLRRLGPAMGEPIVITALVMMTVITAMTFSPWPNWIGWQDADRVSNPDPGRLPISHAAAAESPGSIAAESGTTAAPSSGIHSSVWAAAMDAFAQEMGGVRTPAATAADRWRWPAIVVLVVLAGSLIGLCRLIVGLIWVRRYRCESTPMTDPAIRELADVLAAQLSCRRMIEIRESVRLSSAATIGWFRPLILLPADWREWTDDERRAVLAHEIAHIHHNDYLTWLATQIGLLPHFYHPLAHWLCRCLRIDQELFADSVAARLAGGPQCYVQSLAQLALRSADRPLAWPARTFLPTRRTFLRRIEMLRDSKELAPRSTSALRWLAVGSLVATCILAVGLRGPMGEKSNLVIAQEKKPALVETGAADGEAISLSFVPRDAAAVAAIRPAALLERPSLKQISAALGDSKNIQEEFGMPLDRMKVVLFVTLPPGPEIQQPVATIIRTKTAEDANKLIQMFGANAQKESFGNFEILRNGPVKGCALADPTTVVMAYNDGVLKRCLAAGTKGASAAKWADSWSKVAGRDAAAIVNVGAFREMANMALRQPPPNVGPGATMPLAAFSPFWEQADVIYGGIQIGDKLNVQLHFQCPDDKAAQKVKNTADAGLTLVRNLLSQGRQAAAVAPDKQGPALIQLLDSMDEVLDNVRIEQTDKLVKASAESSSQETMELVSGIVPAVTASREAARRMVSSNNLKQIALAFHNYADTYRHFPPAVLYSENGVPRSWRVEILPFLDQAALYNEYRKDEAWDSPHNKALIARIPATYRHPNDSPMSVNASYFGITGPGSIFDSKEGSSFAEIPDGTSNTLMIVEAKRDIPWTKPDDIPFSPDKDLPKFGGWTKGGYMVAICDGSVRFLAETMDPKILKLLIMKNDGQPLPPY